VAVAARIEHGVKISLSNGVEFHCVGKFMLRCQVGFETMRQFGLKIGKSLFGSSGGCPPAGGQHDIGASIFEHVIRGGKLFKPEAGFLTGVTQFTERSEPLILSLLSPDNVVRQGAKSVL
jgi:hypothetical protein